MQPELIFKAITHSTIAVAIVAVLLLLLVGLRRERNGGEPIGRIVSRNRRHGTPGLPRVNDDYVLG